jgi:ribosomal protein S18 acetylase RimI-like enzyme
VLSYALYRQRAQGSRIVKALTQFSTQQHFLSGHQALASIRHWSYSDDMSRGGDSILRAARTEDLVALRAVLLDTFEITWRPNITRNAAQAYIQEDRPAAYVGSRGLRFWVAETSGEVVGFVDWEGDFVNALHVRFAHARQGIGTRLLDHAEAQIAQAGFASVRLETDTFNLRSQAFYEARGYREAARYPDEEWNSDLTTILLVKPLP